MNIYIFNKNCNVFICTKQIWLLLHTAGHIFKNVSIFFRVQLHYVFVCVGCCWNCIPNNFYYSFWKQNKTKTDKILPSNEDRVTSNAKRNKTKCFSSVHRKRSKTCDKVQLSLLLSLFFSQCCQTVLE